MRNKIHINRQDAFKKNIDKNTLWGLHEVYLPQILTEESDVSKHQRLFFKLNENTSGVCN